MIRPLRGQVVVREEEQPCPSDERLLWTPRPNPRTVTTHTGRILALGPPARTANGVEVPHAYHVGDLVQFHFNHLEELLTNTWEDGLPAIWLPQQDVDAVWEPGECGVCSGDGIGRDEYGEEVDLCEPCQGTGLEKP